MPPGDFATQDNATRDNATRGQCHPGGKVTRVAKSPGWQSHLGGKVNVNLKGLTKLVGAD